MDTETKNQHRFQGTIRGNFEKHKTKSKLLLQPQFFHLLLSQAGLGNVIDLGGDRRPSFGWRPRQLYAVMPYTK